MKLRKVFLAVCLLAAATVSAQQMPTVPKDEKVKVGKLENGLTYYLRHNAYPEGVASFYIAQKVGSVNEEENQRGLAHLLEHMAFNGTDHFRDNTLQEYLQSLGVEYARNLNAETSEDQTVYYFTDTPVRRASAVDSCMLILKDWSNGITLAQKAIDDERDVIHTEYRMRMVGQLKLLEEALPALYPGSLYGTRFPIGLMSVIDGCNPETLRAYYRKWYRPDNQAIIIVGDIDVDKIEAKIKELFGGITVPADAAQVTPVEVPDNEQAIYVVKKNKEVELDQILLALKSDVMPAQLKGTMAYQLQNYIASLAVSMFNSRMAEKANETDSPFLAAQSTYGMYLVSRTKEALEVDITPKPGKLLEAYAAVLKEMKSIHENGFTETEFTRAKDEFMSKQEMAYTNRDKMKNDEFTGKYVSNFINGDPIPSVETEYRIYQQLSQNISLAAVNQAVQEMFSQDDKNFVTLVMLQEKDGAAYPTEQELAKTVAEVRAAKVEAYVDNVKQGPLVPVVPKAGSVVKTTENEQLGFKELQLSNGAKVLLKKTDFKKNEIAFICYANGGKSAFPEEKGIEMQVLPNVMAASGLGNFTNTELQKSLAGKQIGLQMYIQDYVHGLQGQSTSKDMETFMQLVYLNMTSLTKDEKSVANIQQQFVSMLSNQSNNPDFVFQDSLYSTVYCGSKMWREPTPEEIKGLNYDTALADIKDLYSNARDFTFIFVGNYDENTLLPLINTYIASLPNSGKTFQNTQVKMAAGKVSNVFDRQMENPQTCIVEFWNSAPAENNLSNRVNCDVAGRILEMYYLRTIREQLSAAYHAEASGTSVLTVDGKRYYMIQASAGLNPEKSDKAIPYFFSGMKEACTSPNAKDIEKAKKALLKQADIDAKGNNYWLNVLGAYTLFGIDIHTGYKDAVNAVNGETVSAFLNNVILKSGNQAEVLMKAVK